MRHILQNSGYQQQHCDKIKHRRTGPVSILVRSELYRVFLIGEDRSANTERVGSSRWFTAQNTAKIPFWPACWQQMQ
jgi:hypothetical protein